MLKFEKRRHKVLDKLKKETESKEARDKLKQMVKGLFSLKNQEEELNEDALSDTAKSVAKSEM